MSNEEFKQRQIATHKLEIAYQKGCIAGWEGEGFSDIPYLYDGFAKELGARWLEGFEVVQRQLEYMQENKKEQT